MLHPAIEASFVVGPFVQRKKEGNAQALEQTRKTRIQGDTPGGVVLSMSRLSSLPFTSSCPAGRLCAHHTPHRTWPHSMRQLAQRTMTHRPPRRDTSLDACDLSQCHWYLGPRDDGETRGWRIVAACHRLAASLSCPRHRPVFGARSSSYIALRSVSKQTVVDAGRGWHGGAISAERYPLFICTIQFTSPVRSRPYRSLAGRGVVRARQLRRTSLHHYPVCRHCLS